MAETKATKKTTKKATTAVRRVTTRRKRIIPTHEEIATRAYYLHLEGAGDATENWLRAERELVTA